MGKRKNKSGKASAASKFAPMMLKETPEHGLFDSVSPIERELLAILSTCRTPDGAAEKYIITEYIDSIDGMQCDSFGNRWIRIGTDSPHVAFTCHTDSVHFDDGVQKIAFDGELITLAPDSKANCLGADCGIGIWIMRNMILRGVSGLYLFHRLEESGMIGAEHIAEHSPELVKGVLAMVSFDRKGKQSIITHQMGERTCSGDFVKWLASALVPHFGESLETRFKGDDSGMYTDSYAYRLLVPECTNISVGYYSQHSSKECQSMSHALALLDAMCGIDWDSCSIHCTRDPLEVESVYRFDDAKYAYLEHGTTRTLARDSWKSYRVQSMRDLICDYPDEIEDILRDYGFDEDELLRLVKERNYNLVPY